MLRHEPDSAELLKELVLECQELRKRLNEQPGEYFTQPTAAAIALKRRKGGSGGGKPSELSTATDDSSDQVQETQGEIALSENDLTAVEEQVAMVVASELDIEFDFCRTLQRDERCVMGAGFSNWTDLAAAVVDQLDALRAADGPGLEQKQGKADHPPETKQLKKRGGGSQTGSEDLPEDFPAWKVEQLSRQADAKQKRERWEQGARTREQERARRASSSEPNFDAGFGDDGDWHTVQKEGNAYR
jgi:hypothetical protein